MQQNFLYGELIPSLWGQTLSELSTKAARRIENLNITLWGSLQKRPGTLAFGESDGYDKNLYPFSVGNQIVLIFETNEFEVLSYETGEILHTRSAMPDGFRVFINYGHIC